VATHHRTKPARQRVVDARQRRLLYFVQVLVAAAVVAVFSAWFITRDNGARVSIPPIGSPAAVSQAQVRGLAAQTNHPLYWAGPKRGVFELTRTSDGRVYVRYLPSAAKVGDPAATYLTIGTYPSKDAFTAIRRAAARRGAVSLKIDHGGLVVFNQSTPKSVYFAYPGATYQVEVYDPDPQLARTLVLGGKITPIK
jgi:hypothetical protein